MSAIFIVDLKRHNLSFDSMDDLARKIVKIALKEKIGVFFNSFDYAVDLIEDAKMKSFFLLSDSFFYKNCDFLNTDMFDISNKRFKKIFIKKYKFVEKILCEIKKAGVTSIDVYISCDGCTEVVSDFIDEKANMDSFLEGMFRGIFKYSNEYAYGFPTVKYSVDLN